MRSLVMSAVKENVFRRAFGYMQQMKLADNCMASSSFSE